MTATITTLKPRKTRQTGTLAHAIAAHPTTPNQTFEPHLDLKLIDPDPQNRVWDSEHPEFVALLTSIAAIGVQSPILVRPNPKGNGRYDLIAGERRYRASLVTASTIPAIIAVIDDATAAIRQALENMRRHNLTPAEEIRAIVRCHTAGATVTTLANELGVSTKWVNNRLKLIELPPKFITALDKGDLTWEAIEQASTLPPEIATKCGTTQWEIRAAAEKEKAKANLEKKAATLTKQGIRVIVDPTTKTTNIWDLGLHNTDQTAHAKEPCAAIHLKIGHSATIQEAHVCINPDAHKKGGTSKLQARTTTKKSPTEERRIIRAQALIAWATNYIPQHQIEPADYTRICNLTINGCSWTVDNITHALQILGTPKKEIRDLTSVTRKKNRLHEYTKPGGIPGGAILVALTLWITSTIGAYTDNFLIWEWATTKGFTDPYPPEQQTLPEDKNHNDPHPILCTECESPLSDLDIEGGYTDHEECQSDPCRH